MAHSQPIMPGINPMRRAMTRWVPILSSFLSLMSGAVLRGDDDKPAGAVPKGDVIKYTFEESKIFPGTERDYWIYVPKQYDPAKPACVYVN
jgi:hypothetical protein